MGAPSGVDVLTAWQRDTLERCNSVKVGTVVSYNDPPPRASIQPGQQGADAVGTPTIPPVMPDVPVLWPSWGGIRLKGRLSPGDEVLLLVADRALDRFLAQGGVAPLESDRLHHPHDALAIPYSLSALATAVQAPSLDALRLGRPDGTQLLELSYDGTSIRLDASTAIRLGTLAAAVRGAVVDGTGTLASVIAAQIIVLNAITGVGPDGPNVEAIAASMVSVLSALAVSTKVLVQP